MADIWAFLEMPTCNVWDLHVANYCHPIPRISVHFLAVGAPPCNIVATWEVVVFHHQHDTGVLH